MKHQSLFRALLATHSLDHTLHLPFFLNLLYYFFFFLNKFLFHFFNYISFHFKLKKIIFNDARNTF